MTELNAYFTGFFILVDHLLKLYNEGDEKCIYWIDDKILNVDPFVRKYVLSSEAEKSFQEFHDHVEMDILQKHRFNLHVSGKLFTIYSFVYYLF